MSEQEKNWLNILIVSEYFQVPQIKLQRKFGYREEPSLMEWI